MEVNLTLNYHLTKEDHLAFQLYDASTSERIRKKRRYSRLRVPIVYLILGAVLIWAALLEFGLLMMVIGALWYFIYPKYEAKRYKKHFQEYVDENFKEKHNEAAKLELDMEHIYGSSSLGESKIKVSEVDRIEETSEHIFIRVGAMGFVVPKRKVDDLNELNAWVNKVVAQYGVPHNVNLNWKWE